jgi:hypothetical protein
VKDSVDGQLVPIEHVDGAGDLGVAGEPQLDGGAAGEQAAELVLGEDVPGVAGCDHQVTPLGVVAEGDQAETAGGLTGYQGEGFCIRQQAGEVGAGLVKAAGQGIAQRGLGKKAQTDELPADDLPGARLFAQGDVELVAADQAQGNERLANGLRGLRRLVHGDASTEVSACRRAAHWDGLKRVGCCAAMSRAMR